jgi:hypothetical protein
MLNLKWDMCYTAIHALTPPLCQQVFTYFIAT